MAKTIRIKVPMGTYLVHNPTVVESRIFGPCLSGTFSYEVNGYAEPRHNAPGLFPLRKATLVEPAS